MKNKSRFSENYRSNINPFWNRLQAIWTLLTQRNFILIHVKGDRFSVTRRTDFDLEMDCLALQSAFINTLRELRVDNKQVKLKEAGNE